MIDRCHLALFPFLLLFAGLSLRTLGIEQRRLPVLLCCIGLFRLLLFGHAGLFRFLLRLLRVAAGQPQEDLLLAQSVLLMALKIARRTALLSVQSSGR